MSETDRERLIHMLDAAREAVSFLDGRVRDGFGKERMLLLAVVKDIEIVGEAASKVSAEQRSKSVAIPSREVIGMRNHLTHGYFDWDLDVVWQTVRSDLPALIVHLERELRPH